MRACKMDAHDFNRERMSQARKKSNFRCCICKKPFVEIQVVSLSCLDELDLSVETGVLFQVTGQKIEPAPYMKEVQ